MPDRTGMQERLRLSFCHGSAMGHFLVIMSMQMDGGIKEGQMGTLWVWIGALARGVGRWVKGRH
eukprot:1160586-Pelagomonas_calceolata.AAC.2